MNDDNPPNQVRRMEPSLVEKLNNLMKHEASISASISASGEKLNLTVVVAAALLLTRLRELF
jgi:hypothetical protein